MRALSGLLLALALAPAAHAQQARPQKLGDYQSWIAATYTEGGQKVCYAFTRTTRQGVLLTVTHRPGRRDTVTVSAGYTYPRNAEAMAVIGGTDLPFYTAGSTAAARDGSATVRAMRNGREMLLRGPGANGRGTTSDTFPLAGFTAAYEAISKECPSGGRG
ncbi:invasion associated locus B family protein [Belnapia moabensis]|uniref:invasion associated locus B family protein n=1 Tax=Belnapia moabensis TaxID=365533 RepID=UPI0005BD1FE2|nr:invasion associated locus B family protein [Belnapia moabensis]